MLISVKDGVLRKIKDELGDDGYYKFGDRLRVWADVEMYNYKEDKFIWGQKREKTVNHFSIYLDNVFISGFDEDEPVEQIMLNWWRGLKAAIEKKQLDLDPFKSNELRLAKEMKYKQDELDLQAKINALPDDNPTQKIAKEVVKRASKTAT